MSHLRSLRALLESPRVEYSMEAHDALSARIGEPADKSVLAPLDEALAMQGARR